MKMTIDKEWFERRAKAEADLDIGAGFSVVNPTDADMAQMEVVAERALPQWAQGELARLRAIALDMQKGYIAARDLVERAQAIISTSTYPNWHKAARAALSTPTPKLMPDFVSRDVHEALMDSQYRAGAQAGWNAAQLPEQEAAEKFAQLIKVEAGDLAALRRPSPAPAQNAPVDQNCGCDGAWDPDGCEKCTPTAPTPKEESK